MLQHVVENLLESEKELVPGVGVEGQTEQIGGKIKPAANSSEAQTVLRISAKIVNKNWRYGHGLD